MEDERGSDTRANAQACGKSRSSRAEAARGTEEVAGACSSRRQRGSPSRIADGRAPERDPATIRKTVPVRRSGPSAFRGPGSSGSARSGADGLADS